MNFIKEQIEYLKDNPKGYWFKRKLYGWGWTPATKEGWFLMAFYVFSILYIAFTEAVVETLLLEVSVVTALFIFVVFLKGESPKWQWGKKETDEN